MEPTTLRNKYCILNVVKTELLDFEKAIFVFSITECFFATLKNIANMLSNSLFFSPCEIGSFIIGYLQQQICPAVGGLISLYFCAIRSNRL